MLTRGARGPDTSSQHPMKETVNVLLDQVQVLLRLDNKRDNYPVQASHVQHVCAPALIREGNMRSPIRAEEPSHWPDVPSLAPQRAENRTFGGGCDRTRARAPNWNQMNPVEDVRCSFSSLLCPERLRVFSG